MDNKFSIIVDDGEFEDTTSETEDLFSVDFADLNLIETEAKIAKENEKKKTIFKNKPNKVNIMEELGNIPIGRSYEIIDNKLSRNIFKKVASGVGILVFVVVFFLISHMFLNYKFIGENIKGTEKRIGSFSIIPIDYQSNLDELKFGDVIIRISEKQPEWFPFIVSYDKYIYQGRNGYIIYVSNYEGTKTYIQSNDIKYVIPKEE